MENEIKTASQRNATHLRFRLARGGHPRIPSADPVMDGHDALVLLRKCRPPRRRGRAAHAQGERLGVASQLEEEEGGDR
jgi:hypothetical protein